MIQMLILITDSATKIDTTPATASYYPASNVDATAASNAPATSQTNTSGSDCSPTSTSCSGSSYPRGSTPAPTTLRGSF